MSETRFSSLAERQGNQNKFRNKETKRRWLLALCASLLAHSLFWVLRGALPVPAEPKMDLTQSLTVTLTPVATQAHPTESRAPSEIKQPPPPPSKPKVITKPKAIPPKPVILKSEEPAPSRLVDPVQAETPQEAKKPSTSSGLPSSSSSPTNAPVTESAAGQYEGPKLNADYLHNPRPDYPAQAKRMGWEGRVVLRVEVLANGNAGAVSVAKSSGHELLDEAALEAVRRWQFVPAKRDGTAVKSSVNVPITFNLKNE